MSDPQPIFDGMDENGTVLTERELFDKMWLASWKATQQCQAQGYGLGDKVTKQSARAAAEEVYRQYRPQDFVAPVIPLPPIPDPIRDRMEREPERLDDDTPF
jgi:hypothetical protein